MLLSYQASLGSVFHSLLWKNQDYHSAIIITRNKFDKKKVALVYLPMTLEMMTNIGNSSPERGYHVKVKGFHPPRTAILKLFLSPSNFVATSPSAQKAASRQIVEVSSHSPGWVFSSPAAGDTPPHSMVVSLMTPCPQAWQVTLQSPYHSPQSAWQSMYSSNQLCPAQLAIKFFISFPMASLAVNAPANSAQSPAGYYIPQPA